MSNSIVPLKTVVAKDPITRINSQREYILLEGGKRTTYKPYISTSFSNSSAQFSIVPPSPSVIVNRKVYIQMPVTITFNGTSGGAGQNLLQTGYDAFRAYPISKVTNTLTVTINNNSSSINMHDTIDGLSRYNACRDLKEYNHSFCPNYLDEYQTYEEAEGSARNPLGGYADNSYMAARGAFPMTVTTNNTTDAVISAVITEPIMLSPFCWSKRDQAGFHGVQNIDFNFTFLNNLSYMWSHSNAGGSTLNSITVQFGAPSILMNFITPKELMYKNPKAPTVYPFFDVQRYPTDSNQVFQPFGTVGDTQTFQSANIQLQSIPRRMYVWARVRNIDQNENTTDSFLSINNISLNWNNNASLLSSASKQDLYEMSVLNGFKGNWNQWNGYTNNMSGTDNDVIGLSGSVLCLEFGTDIGLDSNECPGILGTYQLQYNVNMTNTKNAAVTPTLYTVIISEGTLTVLENRTIANIGVISKQDILNSLDAPEVNYYDIMDYEGGDFLSGLKDFFSSLWSGVKTVAHDIPEIVGNVAPLARAFIGAGGVVSNPVKRGGKMMSRRSLKDRLRR